MPKTESNSKRASSVSTPPVPTTPEAVSFEEALRELESVVGTLEDGGVPLETSLDMLKRGLELADRCERVLAEAELTLEKLVLTEEGEHR